MQYVAAMGYDFYYNVRCASQGITLSLFILAGEAAMYVIKDIKWEKELYS